MLFSGANAVYNRKELGHKATDYYIALSVQNALKNDLSLRHHSDISATSFNKIILLVGQADTAKLRLHAAKVAQQAAANTDAIRIYNYITVQAIISKSQIAEDAWITTKIKSRLIANNNIDQGTIKVVTENGTVFLMGVVPRDQADIAVNIASDTAGVKKVIKIFYYVIMPNIN